MKSYMPLKVLFAIMVFCVCEVRSDVKQELFNRCVVSENTNYLHAVSLLFQQQDTKTFLSNVTVSFHVQITDRRLADILLCRMEYPQVFCEVAKYVSSMRKKPDAISGRPGYLSGFLWTFAGKEPEDKYVDEQCGTKFVGIIETPTYKKVEKYSDQKVAQGKALNLAAQYALVEYYLKFSGDFNNYEMAEMLECMQKLEKGGFPEKGQRRQGHVITKDLLEAAAVDSKRPISVRIKALSLLPPKEVDLQAIAALEFAALADPTLLDENNKIHYDTIFKACSFFKDFGTAEDLMKLKSLTHKDKWRSKLADEAIRTLESRLGKESSTRSEK